MEQARVRALASCNVCGTVTVPAPSMTVRASWDFELVTVSFECPTCERPGEVRASLERASTLLGDPRVAFEIRTRDCAT